MHKEVRHVRPALGRAPSCLLLKARGGVGASVCVGTVLAPPGTSAFPVGVVDH